MVHKIESSGAIVDMDMSTSLLFDALSAMGCDYNPLLVVEDSGTDRREWYCNRLIIFIRVRYRWLGNNLNKRFVIDNSMQPVILEIVCPC